MYDGIQEPRKVCYWPSEHNEAETKWATFADDTFKRILFNENVCISIKISLKFVPKGQINNIPALVQIMAWCHPGTKALSEAMTVSFPTHICITLPQRINNVCMEYSVGQIERLDIVVPLEMTLLNVSKIDHLPDF